MIHIDDFRFLTHQVLLELDAATAQMIMLVTAGQVVGPDWLNATDQLKNAYGDWSSLLGIPIANADLYSAPIPPKESAAIQSR